MIDGDKSVTVRDLGNRRKRSDSVLQNSILFGYVDTRSVNAIKDRCEAFDNAAAAFRKEAVSALTVKPLDDENDDVGRYELIHSFIVKLLLYIGKLPTDSSFVIAARLIEARVLRPEINISDLIKELAASIDSTFTTVKRVAEGCFNCYDERVVERISYLTGTEPQTALEAICDLAIYIRLRLYNEHTHA